MSTFAPHDEESLLAAGLFSAPSSTGTRLVHKRRLNCFSDEYADLPLSPISTVSSASDMFIEVPDRLISRATLKFLGYADETAARLWHVWTSWPAGCPVQQETESDAGDLKFVDFAIGRSEGGRQIADPYDDDEPWLAYMNHCGIDLDVQRGIMDPAFRQVRLTESCHFWVVDTMEVRYRGLLAIQQTSRARAVKLQEAMEPQGTNLRPGASSTDASSTARSGTGQPPISAVQRMALGTSSHTATPTTLAAAHEEPDTITLFMGVDKARSERVFNNSGVAVSSRHLLSISPCEFSSRSVYISFVVDRDIAVYYANCIKYRFGIDSVVILQVTVKKSAIESLTDEELQTAHWPSSEWKQLIFTHHKGGRIPSELRKFGLATLIVGTIPKISSFVHDRMTSPEDITEREVLKNKDGRAATQYVFTADQGEDFFDEHALASMTVSPLREGE